MENLFASINRKSDRMWHVLKLRYCVLCTTLKQAAARLKCELSEENQHSQVCFVAQFLLLINYLKSRPRPIYLYAFTVGPPCLWPVRTTATVI